MQTYGLVPPSLNVRSHNALKCNALAIIAFVDGGNSAEMISLILPNVFSLTQLKEEKKYVKNS